MSDSAAETKDSTALKTGEKPFSEKTPEEKYQDIAKRVDGLLTAHGVDIAQKQSTLKHWKGKSEKEYSVALKIERKARGDYNDWINISIKLGEKVWGFAQSPSFGLCNLVYIKNDLDEKTTSALEYGDYNYGENSRCFPQAKRADVFEKFDELLKNLEMAPTQQ